MMAGTKWLHLYVNALCTLQEMLFRSQRRKCVPDPATVGHCATDHTLVTTPQPTGPHKYIQVDISVCLKEAHTEKFLSETVLPNSAGYLSQCVPRYRSGSNIHLNNENVYLK